MNSRTRLTVLSGAILLMGITGVIFTFAVMGNKTPLSAKVNVVAAENFWGDIASQIGGTNVKVTSVISDPSADPHLYESDARDASAITSADIAIVNGLGYDDFMSKLLDVSPNQNRIIINAADVLKADSDANPHIWYDIPRVSAVASAFEQAFAKKDPADAPAFSKNLATFNASLQPLLDELNSIKAIYPGAPVAYTERVPGYLLSAAGLSVKTPSGFASAIEDGNEPSPADQSALLSLITGKQIRALLYNAQASSPVTERIHAAALQNNTPVIPITETLPANQNYQAWQKAQLDAIRAALDNTK